MNNIITPWGEIGYIVFKRTYSRRLKEDDPNSETEEFIDVINRELLAISKQLKLKLTDDEIDFYRNTRLLLKWSVAGRFMWQLGTKTVNDLGLTSLQNCAGVVVDNPIRPFTWAMELLMLGCGVGFNIQKEYVYQLPKLKKKIKIERLDTKDANFILPDTREGWVKLLGKTLKAHFYSGEGFTYSTQLIRSKGAAIKGFGGLSSGPEELCNGINDIHNILNSRSNQKLRPIDCLDIMNIIGSIVVAGNVRRSAQIAIGDYDDLEFLKAKRWDLGQIPNWRAMSNNSVACDNIENLPIEFWQTYEQGEPYGLINLRLARLVGRTGETQYSDKDTVVFNPCFTSDTKILTPEGYVEIGKNVGELELINKEGLIVNGNIWSNGFKTVIEILTSQKNKLKCTPDHIFMLNDGSECTAIELLGKRIMPYFSINEEISEYTKYGFIQGDGNLTRLNSEPHKGLEINIGENDYDIFELFDIEKEENKRSYYTSGFNEILKILGFDSSVLPIRRMPNTFSFWSNKDKLMFLKGMYSANGSIIKNHRISYKTVSQKLALELQEALLQFDICSYITINKEKEVLFSNGNYSCKESYDINISKYDSILQFAKLIGFVHKYKNESLRELILAKSPKVISIKDVGYQEVFDFNLQDDTHWGVIDGLIAHNCSEQSLHNYETCCLSEVFLPNIESYEELLKILEITYKVNKHSLAISCNIKETEEIVHKNMRMGIGMTGILQATEKQRSWLKNAYIWLREFDKIYSKENNFPTSIKLTTVKPSGSLSLLAGVTPGIHPNPAGPYYIRRVRMAANSVLVNSCREHGFLTEHQINFDGSEDKSTIVVSFPCKVSEDTPIAANYGWKEQIEMVRKIQSEWSDNSVSCTIYYKKEDLEDIKAYLKTYYEDNFKTLSFLLYHGHGFIQAPYETIDKETYEKMVSTIRPITSINVKEKDFNIDECENGACPIK
ncbi:MAG TPA: LAGLIDADG family homing endonuclease [Burkholderiales bacterium]|nr:LAGLIDADG family homing endonuclease [Burkholderiales bacterium]